MSSRLAWSSEFQDSLGYIEKPVSKNQKERKKERNTERIKSFWKDLAREIYCKGGVIELLG